LDIILVVAIFFGAGFFIFGTARVFKAHTAWRNSARDFEKAIAAEEVIKNQLIDGTTSAENEHVPGVSELKEQLNRLAISRGEAWFGAAPGRINPDTGALTLTINAPEPHGVTEGAELFIFTPGKEQNSPAAYVGKFKVTSAPEKAKAIEIAPVLPLTQPEIQKISRMPGPWSAHLMMPIDDPAVLASMSEGARAAFLNPLPQQIQDVYGDTKREPLDFDALFRDLYYRRMRYYEASVALGSDVTRLITAIEQAKADIAFREAEKSNLTFDKTKFQYELQQLQAYLDTLQKKLKSTKSQLAKVNAENRKLSADLTAWQLKLADEINHRDAAATSPESPAPAVAPN
jgi:hypothetical protein